MGAVPKNSVTLSESPKEAGMGPVPLRSALRTEDASPRPLGETHRAERIPHGDMAPPAQPRGGPLHRPSGFGCQYNLPKA